MKRAGYALVCLVVAAACGDDGTGTVDAGDSGADGRTDSSMVFGAPVAPTPPALPNLLPCAPGWREVPHGDGFMVCEPWPAAGRGECAAGAVHYPGTAGCVPLGPECPADGVPIGLPGGRTVLYVRPGAEAGTGAAGSPFGTIAEATAVAVAGTVIALAVGDYEEEVTLGAGIALVGACVTGTTITEPSARLDRGVINPEGADVEVRNLTIGSSPRPGLWILGEGVSVTATDLAIVGTRVVGISVERGAHLDADRISVRDVEDSPPFPLGRALNVETGATATVRHLDARRNVEFGVAVLAGGELHLEDSIVAETRAPGPDVNGGPGLGVFTGGHLTAQRVVLEDSQQGGVMGFDEGSVIDLSDVMVRRVEPWGERGAGRAFDVERGASLTCRRCLLTEAREIGVGVGGATVVLEDVLIEHVGFDARGMLGRGMVVQTRGVAIVDRLAILDVSEFGIVVGESRFTANDVVIRRLVPQRSDGWFGRALGFQAAANVEIRRIEASDLYEVGMLVAGSGTDVFMEDVLIKDVRSRPDGFLGEGIIVEDHASTVLSRVHIENVRETAVAAIRGATLTINDLVIRGVSPQGCQDTACAAFPGGHGLGAYDSQITVDRFLIEAADLCGIHVADDGQLFLEEGVVRGAAIGACVQSDTQDLADLSRSVDYLDNGTNLEATMLPVPEPLAIAE